MLVHFYILSAYAFNANCSNNFASVGKKDDGGGVATVSSKMQTFKINQLLTGGQH